jgi:hypothetical protein
MSVGKARRLLREISQVQSNGSVFVCEVTDVNGGKCNAMPLDGSAEFKDVRLNTVSSDTAGIVITPAKKSLVLVHQISSVDSYVSQFSEIEKIDIEIGDIKLHLNANEIVFNEGDLGLVKIDKLIAWMQKVSDDLQDLSTSLSAHPVVGNGAALALTFVPSVSSPNRTDFEDTKIKH